MNVAPLSLVYFILVQFYGVIYVCALVHKYHCDRLLISYAVKRTIMLRRETWIRRRNEYSCIKLFLARVTEVKRLHGSFLPGLQLLGSRQDGLARLSCNRIVEKLYYLYRDLASTINRASPLHVIGP